MTDAHSAIDAAAFALLAGAGLSAPVHQHVTRDTPLPVVVIGDMENVAPIGRGGDPDVRGALSIVVLTEGEERRPCTDLMAEVRAALDGKTSTATPGWSVAFTFGRSTAVISEDGLGYVGIILFDVIALTS